MLDLARIDIGEIATAPADQTDYEHRWLIDPRTGQVALWPSDTGIDGENPVEIDELDLTPIDPLPFLCVVPASASSWRSAARADGSVPRQRRPV